MSISCTIGHMARSYFHDGINAPHLVLSRPCDNNNMDFIVALPQRTRGKDAINIMIVVGRFFKMP